MENEPIEDGPPARRPRRRGKTLAVIGGVIAAGLLAGWLSREQLADRFIAGQLETMGLPATYEVESIGPRKQVLRNIVVGDPARPDLTIDRAEVVLSPAGLGAITLTRPRLFGSWRDGKLSFGRLDPLIFTGSKEPFRLPDLNLAIHDGRALLDSDHGAIGVKAEGQGPLRSGFRGIVAAVAPQVQAGGCEASGASLYAKLAITGERPRLQGPLRLASLACEGQGLRLAKADVEIDTTLDAALDGAEGGLSVQTGALEQGANRAASLAGITRFTWRKGILDARPDLALQNVRTPQAAMARLGLRGSLRAPDVSRFEFEGDVAGDKLRTGDALDAGLAQLQKASADTLAAPLAGRLRGALRREVSGSNLKANLILRRNGDALSLVVPQGSLRGASGATLLSLSRFHVGGGEQGARIAGNFATGGRDLPQIVGRMERDAGGRTVMRLSMAEYAAGEARLALPNATLIQLANGTIGFSGETRMSGALPGGSVGNLVLPVEGNWSSTGGLAMWRRCVTPQFDNLAVASLVIERRSLTLCPQPGGAIVRSGAGGAGGLRIAAGATSLDLAGRMGQTPIRIASGPIGFAWPGNVAARSLDVALGPADTASRFRIANLGARIGSEARGRFAGADVRLNAVPLDLLDAAGEWRFAGGKLAISGASLRVEDRQLDDRFQPLLARDATLTLADNLIHANALLREPASDREVLRTAIRHDLARGIGNADLAVDGIRFDGQLQPDTLTRLALGVVANTSGTVRGAGRIDWTPQAVTSTGRFATDALDFAAAFGPVTGASGEIVFTDLLGLVTAPDQKLRIASVNPGIEVNDGILTYALLPGNVLEVAGARWPFHDGTLQLLPTRMRFGVAETRRYTLAIEGLDAAKFVSQMDIGNLMATGSFDGRLPLVFDENGGRIEGGMLVSRPPGGNVSYLGPLTYKDLTPMANFAFDALKSIDYRQMRIDMDGPLVGEIVTRVTFDGLSQGSTAKRNFITRQVAKLPIRFNVNLRAPFFRLVRSFKSLYDPSYVRDPRELGLVGANGQPLDRNASGVKPPVSEKTP